MAKQNKKKQERKLAAREKHKNNSKSQDNDSTDDPDLEKQLDKINLKLSYGFHDEVAFLYRPQVCRPTCSDRPYVPDRYFQRFYRMYLY